MLRLLLTLLLLMPLATHASEGEFFLTAKPAEQAQLLGNWAAQPDAARLPLLENLRQGRIAPDDKRKLLFGELLGQAFSGLSLGSILLLAALGLAITFGLLGVINMAHGEMLMLGAYSTYMVQVLVQRYAPGAIEFYPLIALPVAFAISAG